MKQRYPVTGLDRPLGIQEVEADRISRNSVPEGGKVASPTHWPPLPPRRHISYLFLSEAESTPGSKSTGRMKSTKNPNKPIGN